MLIRCENCCRMIEKESAKFDMDHIPFCGECAVSLLEENDMTEFDIKEVSFTDLLSKQLIGMLSGD